jgi:RIO kinase 1
VEQTLDARTRLVLFKMLNLGLFSTIHGCVSTGKEANVYHAVQPDGGGLAVKVYKTSILVFKDRDRYVLSSGILFLKPFVKFIWQRDRCT